MRKFQDLKVWEKSHQLTLDVYAVTKTFPDDERFGMTSQLRRASASIGANIAEGCGRGSDKDFSRFLQIAMGSASEVEYLLILAKDLSLIDPEEYPSFHAQVTEVKRMLTSFIKYLRSKQPDS